MNTSSEPVERCGYIAIVGRPNVGKSTLLNHIVEQKISITSRKPQTTRHNVRAIKTVNGSQMIFVDTPGIHKPKNTAINRYMNRVASSAVLDVDVIIFVVDRDVWTDEDEIVLQRLKDLKTPVILAINKVDRLEDKAKLMPHIERVSTFLDYAEIVPVSALRGQNLDILEQNICARLPEDEHFYPEDQVTDRSCRFMAAELVREKITRQLGEELPYQIAVEIEEFTEENGVIHISALILVERDGQKRIIIGEKGQRLKSIGSEARKEMEELFGTKVMLKLWVKVKAGWSDDDRALRSLGYDDSK